MKSLQLVNIVSQKGVNAVQRYLGEKGAIAVYNVYGDSALLVLYGTSLISINALLALSRRAVANR